MPLGIRRPVALFVLTIPLLGAGAACGAPSAGLPPKPEGGAFDSDASAPDAKGPDGQAPDAETKPEDPTITPGAKDRMLLLGTVITETAPLEGAVLIEGENITCVDTVAKCSAMAGATGATVIDTKGIIAPGLIDTHNHILFDIFDDDDWKPAQLYQNHTEWTAEPRYQAMLDVKQCLVNDSQGKPPWCAQTPYGTAAGSLRCEVDKWGELKALIAGTTSVVGLPGTSSACFGTLARSIDVSQNGLGSDKVQTSALFPPSDPNGVCTNYSDMDTHSFITHAGEGLDALSLGEFDKLRTMTTTEGCLYAPQTAITHGTAFTAAEYAIMAQTGMKLVWSPHSNVSLYGQTTDIPAALDAGVAVSLAPDWSMGGSQNMLDELRFADNWDNTHWNNRLSSKDLVTMSTLNPAKVLALETRIGKLAPGFLADIAVFTGDRTKPYDAIVAARPKNVRLVMIGGTVLYGDKVLESAGPAAPGCETIDICTVSKFLCVATTDTSNKFNQTYAEIKSRLSQALTDADALTTDDGYNFSPLTPLVICN
ncbi:MAG: amidohydrolase family protein [Polyangiaceae bacterium]